MEDDMRRYIVMMLAIGLAAALAAPAPAARRARTVTKGYDSDPSKGGLSAWVGGEYVVFVGDSVELASRPTERMVKLTVEDDSGNPTAFAVWVGKQDGRLFCTDSDAIRFRGGEEIRVRPLLEITPTGGVCDTPAPTTTGTVKATFR